MIRLTFKLVIGVLLTGCTVNNYHPGSFKNDYVSTKNQTAVIDVVVPKEEIKQHDALPAFPIIQGNKHIRAECEIYIPLKVPEPVKIDFKELEKATTSQEINAVILHNIKDMRMQMIAFGIRQEKHYAEYAKRCVIK